jgi:hypothetical protein
LKEPNAQLTEQNTNQVASIIEKVSGRSNQASQRQSGKVLLLPTKTKSSNFEIAV